MQIIRLTSQSTPPHVTPRDQRLKQYQKHFTEQEQKLKRVAGRTSLMKHIRRKAEKFSCRKGQEDNVVMTSITSYDEDSQLLSKLPSLSSTEEDSLMSYQFQDSFDSAEESLYDEKYIFGLDDEALRDDLRLLMRNGVSPTATDPGFHNNIDEQDEEFDQDDTEQLLRTRSKTAGHKRFAYALDVYEEEPLFEPSFEVATMITEMDPSLQKGLQFDPSTVNQRQYTPPDPPASTYALLERHEFHDGLSTVYEESSTVVSSLSVDTPTVMIAMEAKKVQQKQQQSNHHRFQPTPNKMMRTQHRQRFVGTPPPPPQTPPPLRKSPEYYAIINHHLAETMKPIDSISDDALQRMASF